MSIENWPAMPPEITRDGPYRVYKGRQYTVYDDGHSAETPYQTDRADALEARLRTTAEALRAFVDSRRESGWAIAAGKNAGPALNKALPDARAVLAQLEKEGLA
jgi:hypothetical protein